MREGGYIKSRSGVTLKVEVGVPFSQKKKMFSSSFL